MENNKDKKEKSAIRKYLPLIIIMAIVLVGGYLWYRNYSKYISTDDAYVDSDNVSVSAKMMGRIVKLYVDEGDSVKHGSLLVELDSSEMVSHKEQALSGLNQARTAKKQAEASYEYNKASIKLQEIGYEKAQDDYTRAKKQYEGQVLTQEQFDHMQKALQSAKAQLDAAKSRLEVSRTQIDNAEAAIKSAKAQVDVINTQIENARIYAPVEGIIAKRWLLPGDVAQPGQSILTVTNNHHQWITVYLEETKLKGVHNGQSVTFNIDAFPDEIFSGKVFSIGASTASQFSLIPPNNASGNFTKVTQRVPLKISIDKASGHNLGSLNLLPGMSAEIKIKK